MYLKIKQLFDYVFSFCLAIILSPLFIVITIIIKLDSKGPVLFKQKRIGKDNIPFYIYKFRTMRIDTPKDMPTHLFNDATNFITRSGAFLRKSSLDELPQLFNILKGQMSFIGPRPALWNQYDLIELRKMAHADQLKPGITGWAQINGRDELPLEVKADLDGYYAQNISFILDIKIFFKTIINVLKADGIKDGK